MAIWKEHQRESWTKLESLEDLRDFWEVEKIEKIKRVDKRLGRIDANLEERILGFKWALQSRLCEISREKIVAKR